MRVGEYPEWSYYPHSAKPRDWAFQLAAAVSSARDRIDTVVADRAERLTSDTVLAYLAEGLQSLGYQIELGKLRTQKVSRPVLYGSQGRPKLTHEVDAFHDGLGIVLEVEAGRGAQGNAVYRDLIRASLIVDARFFALGVARQYRFTSGGRPQTVHSYADATKLLDAVYASGRLALPFEGVMVFGY